MIITVDILKKIAPGGKKTKFKLFPELVDSMNEWFPRFGIDSPSELQHTVAQLAHESDSFNTLEEYASGKAYEGRKDLGNVLPGDGVKFKGRGPIQTTGRANYERLGQKKGMPNLYVSNPELLATPSHGIWAACVFIEDRNLCTFANMPDSAKISVKRFNKKTGKWYITDMSPIEYITYRINGGWNGLEDRKKFYERAKIVIK
jgi:putative chitinase